jgi:cytochrome P450
MTNAHRPTGAAGPSAEPPPGEYPAHGRAVALYGPRFQNNPAQLYRDLRRQHGSVAPVLLEGDVPAWLVLGYCELLEVTGNSQLFARDSRRWNAWHRVPTDWPLLPILIFQPSALFTEGAEHQRRAGAINDVLAAVDQFELRKHCERTADRLIDTFASSGEADLVNQYARPIPLLAIAWMLGVSEVEASELVRDMYVLLDGSAGAMEAQQRVLAGVARLLDLRRVEPGPDLPSGLLAHPARLADDEIIPDLSTLLGAGQQPTADWIGNALRLMLTNDRFAMTMSGGRGSIGQALNEVLWMDTPTQNYPARWAARDTQLGGQHIRTGDLLVLSYAAANSDPRVRSGSLGTTGGNYAHMSFSHGEHGCPHPARELAEIIAHVALEVLLDRLPDVRLAVSTEALVWRPSMLMRGLSALPVTFSPTYVAGGVEQA